MSLANASASSKCVPWPEKMTSALAAAKSRPVGESPAWEDHRMTLGLRGKVASSEMSNCDVETSTCRGALVSSTHESQMARPCG